MTVRDDIRSSGCATLVDVLAYRAAALGDRVVYRFLPGDGKPELSITYAALERRVASIAAVIADIASPGERAVLLFQPGLDYIAAYFACLAAGVVAVPAYPPNPRRPTRHVSRIVSDCGATVALTTEDLRSRLDDWRRQMTELGALRWLATDTIADDAAPVWRAPRIGAGTLAMLQYTSGSTSTPKGVMVGHGSLLHNLALVHAALANASHHVGVFWLPPFHDMGLIGGILSTCYAGASSVLMAPASFLQRRASSSTSPTTTTSACPAIPP